MSSADIVAATSRKVLFTREEIEAMKAKRLAHLKANLYIKTSAKKLQRKTITKFAIFSRDTNEALEFDTEDKALGFVNEQFCFGGWKRAFHTVRTKGVLWRG